MNRTWMKPLAIAAFALSLATPLGALAAGDTTSVTVTGGDLTISTPAAGDFAGVTLNGAAQTTNATLATFTVTDARGTGAGWTVTAEANQFANSDATHTLPAASLTLTAPTVAPAAGTTSPSPTIADGAPYTIDDGSPVTIATAGTDEGMGSYDFSATTLTLTVPASAYADTYSSDVTITFAVTP